MAAYKKTHREHMSWFTQTVTSSLGKKYIMALTGLLLGGFLLVHAAGNATILLGRPDFLSYARRLHSLGLPLTIAEITLLLLFCIHAVTGLTLFYRNNRARPSPYAVSRRAGGRTWGSATMAWTGIAILCFITLHLANFYFADHRRPLADIVGGILDNPLYSALYCAGLLALTLHISHGFWSMFQSLGLNHPKYNGLIGTCRWILCGGIVGVFLTIVLLLFIKRNYLA